MQASSATAPGQQRHRSRPAPAPPLLRSSTTSLPTPPPSAGPRVCEQVRPALVERRQSFPILLPRLSLSVRRSTAAPPLIDVLLRRETELFWNAGRG
ncbi:hypothetical protein J5N97_013386 [Dioscorea zingiberensis]|uniref:Uncharacterized protein n=1 Tax=Dioscorea zingiberensis TaxID=325984 RepID=A0A9D5HIZ9_9LILI|nr:hypothetical protein J5N97_013386 [Dioscorea zingiberensis]